MSRCDRAPAFPFYTRFSVLRWNILFSILTWNSSLWMSQMTLPVSNFQFRPIRLTTTSTPTTCLWVGSGTWRAGWLEEVLGVPLLSLWDWLCAAFRFLGLPFQRRFYCHTGTFTQHSERFLAYGLGEECLCYCHADQMCWTGKGT